MYACMGINILENNIQERTFTFDIDIKIMNSTIKKHLLELIQVKLMKREKYLIII